MNKTIEAIYDSWNCEKKCNPEEVNIAWDELEKVLKGLSVPDNIEILISDCATRIAAATQEEGFEAGFVYGINLMASVLLKSKGVK